MSEKLSDELRQALEQSSDQQVVIEDERTRQKYVLMSMDLFRQMQTVVYDDSELDVRQTYPLAEKAFAPGWDDPTMDVYDEEASPGHG